MAGTLRFAAGAVRRLALMAVLAAAAACGGGGDGGGPPPPPPPAPSGLSYNSPVVVSAGAPITPLPPAVTGTVSSYSVSPALPAGLVLNSTSGIISGTPAAAAAQATYTVTATNAGGSTTFALVLTVQPPPPSAFTLSALVSDGSASAPFTDPHLRNPWGLAALPNGPFWVANQGDRTSTVYDGTGIAQPLLVNIPAGANGLGTVTGIVASSSTTDFVVSNGTASAPARFIFATESGTLSAWASTVDAANAQLVYDDAGGGAVYKGLAIAQSGGQGRLYAADFRNRKIDVFDKDFAKATAGGGFADPALPADFAPFNIQAVQIGGSTLLAVAYAKQDPLAPDQELAGAGEGILNIFDLNGNLLKNLVARGGQLNAPWGIAVAPADFGTLSNALLVGNFGDGRINGFNADTGAFIHAIGGATGDPLLASGLWGIAFGNGFRNQPANVLYLAAGINGETGGLYARIDLGATAPDIVAPTGVAVTAPAPGQVSGTVTVSASATDNVGVAQVQFFAGTTSLGTDTSAPYSVQWNTASLSGTQVLTAVARDGAGNSTTSAAVTVTVTAPTAPTLAQLQSSIFGPRCSQCHSGGGAFLPTSMNLSTAASTFAALVNVNSQEVPSMRRVAPGDPNNSYVIHKLEGSGSIIGDRMPLGGPFLDQATIGQVRAWIQAGAAP